MKIGKKRNNEGTLMRIVAISFFRDYSGEKNNSL